MRITRWLLVFGACCHFILPGAGAAESGLEAGFAVVDITPPVDFRMSGYFHERRSTGTHDPLLAKAVVLRQGEAQAAMIFCDLISIATEVSDPVRRKAAARTGIPYEHIVLAATHTHTGPLYTGALRDHFVARAEEQGLDHPDEDAYLADLRAGLVEAIIEAHAARAPSMLKHGVGEEDRVAFNRRFYLRDGTVRFNAGKMNPNIVRPAGPIDPEVGLVRFEDADGAPRALLTVYALHLDTVGGTEYAADYPHYLSEALQAAHGPDFLSLFGLGPCGDINHVDVSHREAQKGHEEARRIGEALAESVLEAAGALHATTPSLAVARALLDTPKPEYSLEELAWAHETILGLEDPQVPFLDKVRARALLDLERRPGGTIPIEVQAMRLGEDLALVFLPGELFVELGLALKYASPFEHTFVIELANHNVAYIPTAKAFEEGSYETVNSRVRPGVGEEMIETARRLLYALKFPVE